MSGFSIYSFVTLTRTIERKTASRTVTFPAGTRGMIVHVHADGAAFEVEFEEPTFAVVIVFAADLAPTSAD
jgi:hypothetical protein